MTRIPAFVLAAALLAACPALAAPKPTRIRGTIAGVHGDTLLVHTAAGPTVPIHLTAKTAYREVTRTSLDHVAAGSYIGTATKTAGGKQVALEVLVFPPAMKGVGEGHYPWDRIRDTTRAGHGTTASSMTNGTITAAAPTTVASSMTNGTVATTAGAAGGKQITVTYAGGTQTVIVPPSAPIVTLLPGTRAELKQGAGVFVVAVGPRGKMTAIAVNAGIDGVRPPM